jgi:hypothetical protein
VARSSLCRGFLTCQYGIKNLPRASKTPSTSRKRDARPEKLDDTTNERANRPIRGFTGPKTPNSTREARETVRKTPYRRVNASNRPFRAFYGP